MKEIFIRYERCNGCLTCTLACAAEHSSSKDIVSAMLEGVPPRLFIQTRGRRPVPLLCRHCEEPACVDACMTGAMQKDLSTGVVTNEGHDQACVGCWMCLMSCPYGVITAQSEPQKLALKCDLCPGREVPACVDACPNEALVYTEAEIFAEELRAKAV